MQNKPSTASDEEIGQKGKKHTLGKKGSLEMKKSNHYYKGLYQELLYFPHPICWKSTRASSTVFMSNIGSEHPNAKQKEREKKRKENPQTASPPPQTVE